MNIRLGLLLAVSLVPQACLSQAEQGGVPGFDHNPTGVSSRVTIPFKLYQGYLIVVQGSLGTLNHLNFLIDTGVTPSKVDFRIASKLGLTATKLHKVALFNQRMDVEEVVLPSLQLGPMRTESLLGMVMDLSSFERILGVRIDASIGFDVLSRSSFSIDYKSKKIVFGPIEPSPLSVPFETGPPVLTVEVRVQDEPVHLRVDTGASELVLFNCQLTSRVRQLQTASIKRSFVNAAGGEIGLEVVHLPGLHLGSAEFELQAAMESDDNADCDLPFDGVVGVRCLGLQWVAFDFEHRRLSWKN